MESFYKIVLGIAVVFMILILAIMGVLLKYQNSGQVFPPSANTCPDYWAVDGSGNCICPLKGSLNLGNCKASDISSCLLPVSMTSTATSWSFNPADTAWSSNGQSTVCAQQQWANNNLIVWDGVSNYNSC
jgi:hypothetical protein